MGSAPVEQECPDGLTQRRAGGIAKGPIGLGLMIRPLSEEGTHHSAGERDHKLTKSIRTHTVLCLALFKITHASATAHCPMMLPASVALVALLATGTTSALVVQIDPFASDSIRVRVAPPGVAAVANPPLQVRSRALRVHSARE
jgi:hypothetical protein